MIDAIDLFKQIEVDKNKNISSNISFATVADVTSEGVKIVLDGEESPINCYLNSLCLCNVGDKVYIKKVANTILIIGKLQY